MATKEKINLLEVIPCRNEHISRYLLPKGMSKDIHVRLEEHGTAVWNLIDGQRTVREIIEKLADHFQYEAGYESRVSTYLSQLQKDGFIKWIIIH